MSQEKQNKILVLEYFNSVSGKTKTLDLISKYVIDQAFIEHVLFFDAAFPKYEVILEEMTAEGNRVVTRARMLAKHEGFFGDIMPTYRTVDLPFVVTFTIDNNKIISHWLIADQMVLMEQLGIESTLAEH